MIEDDQIIKSEIPGIQEEDKSFAEAIKIPLQTVKLDNYLGDPMVVQYLVRNFAAGALARRGKIGDDEAMRKDIDDSRNMAKIFLGEDPAYPAMDKWNAPGSVDQYIAHVLNISGTAQEIVSAAMLIFLVEIYKLYNQSVFGGLPENIDWQVDACCEDTTKLLLGWKDGQYTAQDLIAMQEE
jgi:hypothetical protein